MNKSIKNMLLLGAVVCMGGNVMAAYDAADVDARSPFADRMANPTLRRSTSAADMAKAAREYAETQADKESAFNTKFGELYNARKVAANASVKAARGAEEAKIATAQAKIPALATLAGQNRIYVAADGVDETAAATDMSNAANFSLATLKDIVDGKKVLFAKKSGKDEWDTLDLSEGAKTYGISAHDVNTFVAGVKTAMADVETAEKAKPKWMTDHATDDAARKAFYGLDPVDNPYAFNPADAKWAEHKRLYDAATTGKPANFDKAFADEIAPVVAAGAKYNFKFEKPVAAVFAEEAAKGEDSFETFLETLLSSYGYEVVTKAEYAKKKAAAALKTVFEQQVKDLKASVNPTVPQPVKKLDQQPGQLPQQQAAGGYDPNAL